MARSAALTRDVGNGDHQSQLVRWPGVVRLWYPDFRLKPDLGAAATPACGAKLGVGRIAKLRIPGTDERRYSRACRADPTGRTTVHVLAMNARHRLDVRAELIAPGALPLGLGTRVANVPVPDPVAYQSGTFVASGPTVGPLQDANLVDTGTGLSGLIDVFSVFDSLTVVADGLSQGRGSRLGGVPVVRGVPGSTGASEIAMKSPRALAGAMGRSFAARSEPGRAERTTTLPPAQSEASAAVDQVLGTLQTDGDTGGSVIDELAVDLLLPQTRQSHRTATAQVGQASA
jgi:hypothetical protein